MDIDINLLATMLITVGFAFMLAGMAVLVIWARRRSVGVMAVGAFLSVFAPDPTLEQKVKLVEEAKVIQNEEDRQGEL